jgi:hypothetical protein
LPKPKRTEALAAVHSEANLVEGDPVDLGRIVARVI